MFPRHVNSIHTQNCPTKSHASSDFRTMERNKEGKKEIGSSHKGFLKRTITREGREGHVDMNGKFLTPLHIHWHLSSHHAACQDNLQGPWSKPKLMLCSTTRNWCSKFAQISTLEKLWKAMKSKEKYYQQVQQTTLHTKYKSWTSTCQFYIFLWLIL